MLAYLKNYYQDNRAWIIIAAKCFFVAAVIGAMASLVRPDLLQKIMEIFADKFGPEPARDIHLAKEIFLQNSLATGISLFGGIVLGLSSVFILFFNGFIIGFILLILFLSGNGNYFKNLEYLILGLVPHGIFELPAFIFASGLGLRLGIEWISNKSQGHRLQVLKANLKRAVMAIPILLVLLAIAAIVEVFVSGYFVSNF